MTPEWHSWLSHIRKDPPHLDPIVQASRQTWQTVSGGDLVLFPKFKRNLRFEAFSEADSFVCLFPICLDDGLLSLTLRI